MGNFPKAYTTIEVILVIFLIAVWLGVVLPRFGAGDLLNKSRLRTAVYNLASDMRSARNLAVTNARDYIIEFRFAQREYSTYQWSISPPNQVGETKNIPTQITWTGAGQVGFNSLGSANLSGSGIWTFSSGGEQYSVTVISPTGTVRIQ